jgi:hypothetical protein
VRLRLIFVAAVMAALVIPSVAQAYPRLYGKVGPDMTITLKRADGTVVHSIGHGRKTFIIRDRSSAHNFHLFGPGSVDRATGIAFIGRRKWRGVRLRAGTYTYRCDAHTSTMTRTFTVT